MALQTSGPISLTDIKNEFNPFFLGATELSDFYKGGGLVSNTPANIDIPFVGPIALSDFYGASASPEYNPAIMGYNQWSSETACFQDTTAAVYQAATTPNLNDSIYSNSSGTSFSADGYYSLQDPYGDIMVRYWTGTYWSNQAQICMNGDPGGGGGFIWGP
jgi:hypothetical protein